MVRTQRKRQRKRKYGTYSLTKPHNTHRSSQIIIKDFEIFVTDFLTDPCGLPIELKDCVLVDGTTISNDNTSG